MKRSLARYMLGLLVMLGLAACGVAEQPVAQSTATPNASAGAETPKIGGAGTILTIRAEGGLCQAGQCWSEQQISADGSYRVVDATGVQKTGTLDSDAVAELTQLIAATNFAEVRAQPFTGTCPLAFDGQELIYTFQTLSGPETIASCRVGIDENSPLFKQIATLRETIAQE